MKDNPSVSCAPRAARPAKRNGRASSGLAAVDRGGLPGLRQPLAPVSCDAAKAERRLALAVLSEAVHCFQKHASATDRCSQELFRDAEQWFMGRDQGPEFCFEEICEVLKLDPDYLRSGLRRWRERRQRAS